MAIDMHCHYVPAGLADALRERREPPWIEAMPGGSEVLHMPVGHLAFTPDYIDMAARIAFMDAMGVQRQLLSFPGLFGLDSLPAEISAPLLAMFNDDLAALVARHPDRFTGIAALPFADMEMAVAEYRRARRELGFVGAILPNNCFVSKAEADRLRPLFAAADADGAHFFIHPGRRPDEAPPPGSPPAGAPFPDFMLQRQALDVQHKVSQAMVTLLYSGLLDDYPNVSVHVANLGGTFPMVLERMDQAAFLRTPDAPLPSARARRVHVDCSSLGAKALEIAVATFGADRIVLGTDCPIFRTDWSLRAIAEARLDDDQRRAILSGNAEALLSRLTGQGI